MTFMRIWDLVFLAIVFFYYIVIQQSSPPPSDIIMGVVNAKKALHRVSKFQLAHLLASEAIFCVKFVVGRSSGPPEYECS
jgi:hypothetical protein